MHDGYGRETRRKGIFHDTQMLHAAIAAKLIKRIVSERARVNRATQGIEFSSLLSLPPFSSSFFLSFFTSGRSIS